MPAEDEAKWLEVIGRALAYLCVQEATRNDPQRVNSVPAKVKFIEGLGLTTSDAAQIMGTTANSVNTILRAQAKRKGGKSGKKSKK